MSNLPRRSLEKDFSTPPATPLQDENGRLNSTTDEVESLRKQLEHQQRSTNLRKADSSFLQSQLKEKEELLIEVSQLLEAVEKRQNELEDENADLKQRLTALLNERVEL
jgi:septal ring factor EnvC (AmiA/AmiB activator)